MHHPKKLFMQGYALVRLEKASEGGEPPPNFLGYKMTAFPCCFVL